MGDECVQAESSHAPGGEVLGAGSSNHTHSIRVTPALPQPHSGSLPPRPNLTPGYSRHIQHDRKVRTAPAEKYGAELDELSTEFPEFDGLLADMTEDQGGVVRDERTVLMERVYQSPIPLQGGTCMPC